MSSEYKPKSGKKGHSERVKKVLCSLRDLMRGCYLAYSFVLGGLLVVYNMLCNLRTKQKIRATHSYSFGNTKNMQSMEL